MKTSVELDEKKVNLAKKLTHTGTLKELLDKALDAFIARVRRQTMADMLGTDFFEARLKEMRVKRGRSRR